ncbi:von Willebrand factor A-like domain-containing protein [Synechococcus sp. BIOS-U3-1]|nr:von Willebrand factor A-like domain-containing protein [Synechococcus sp. BIOS-U3-1]
MEHGKRRDVDADENNKKLIHYLSISNQPLFSSMTPLTMKFMNRIKQHMASHAQRGFGLPETLIAASAGVVLIGASALALRTTGSLINKMDLKAGLQQNTISGKRMMRSEIERSLHLLIKTQQKPADQLAHTDITHADYKVSLSQCQSLAQESGQVFNPVFGVKMAELNNPVYYGLSLSSVGRGYSLQRCGSSMQLDGRYNEREQQSLAMVIDDIGVIRCASDQPECIIDPSKETTPLSELASKMQFVFNDDKTPERSSREPAIRLMTDENRKLIRFIDPTTEKDNIQTSYLKIEDVNKEITTHPFYFIAYSRADKRIEKGPDDGEVLDGLFFRNVSSKRMRFLVDGSGSMSACILWGSGIGNRKIFWSGRYYFSTQRSCALTRMESLQHELISLLQELPNDTQISLRSFSSPGYQNHRIWQNSAKSLVKIGQNNARDSAIAFVNTLDDGYAYRWGGTDPWEGLNEAFADNNTDTLYFLSDGEPNYDRNRGRWTTADHSSTSGHYAGLNNNREISLKVNTVALGLQSNWMQSLAGKTTGDYLYIDKKYVLSSSTK